MTTSRTPVWVAIGAFALALCLGAGITAAVLVLQARAQSQPAVLVNAYLASVEHGDIEKAQKLEHRTARPADVLLTNRAYEKVTDRVTAHRILRVTEVGPVATVEAEIVQKSGTSETSFSLSRGAWTPLSPLGIETWSLKPADLGVVTVNIGAPGRVDGTVAGVPLGWKGAVIHLDAFPGTYGLTAKAAEPWFTFPAASTTVSGFRSTAVLRSGAVLTPAGTAAAKAAANTWVDACIADRSAQPAGCSFGLTSDAPPGETWTDETWTLQSRPVITVHPWDFDCSLPTQAGVSAGGCWTVTATPGSATFHANYSKPSGETGEIVSTAPLRVSLEGAISSFTQTGATYQSVGWKPGASSGS